MGTLRNLKIQELVEAGIMSSATIHRYIKDQQIQLNNGIEITANDVLEELRKAYLNPAKWIVKKHAQSGRQLHENILRSNRKLCLYLLEECDFLQDLSESEQNALRKELCELCDKCNDFIAAVELLSSGEDRTEAYVESIFTKLQKTGYLYQASWEFRKLIAIFLLCPELMSDKMIQLIDILAMGDSKTWCKPTIRPYIVYLLDFYIGELGKKIDRMSGFNNQSDRQILETAIKTLCIELFLYEDDNISFEKRRSMLYRFASYYSPANSEILLKKAFSSLTGGYKDKVVEYTWDKIASVFEVIILLTVDKACQNTMLRYNGKKASVFIEKGEIIVMPVNSDKKKLQKVFSSGMFPWHNFQVMVADAPKKRPAPGVNDILPYRTWWKDVERSLFDDKTKRLTVLPKNYKRKPIHEEIVDIVIDSICDYKEGKFNCHIVSDKIEAKGTICLSDIVSYRIRPEDYPLLLSKAFSDPETGYPFKFKAEVCHDDYSDEYTFKMKHLVNDYVLREADYIDIQTDAVVTGFLPVSRNYTCVSYEGMTVLVPESDGELKIGEYISVDIVDSEIDRKVGLQFYGRYAGEGQKIVTQQEGLSYLLQYYADGTYDQYAEHQKELASIPKDPYTTIDESIIIELMQLLDCEAVSQAEVHNRYNYLELSKILAQVLDDKAQISYYENRLNLQMVLQDFSKNATINNSKLQELEQLDAKTMSKYPVLKLRLDELHALDCLGKSGKTPLLYQMQGLATNDELRKLLTLSIAYNNLATLGMDEECKKVSDEINSLLRIKYQIKPSVYIGEETEMVEFKTSLVFYANEERKVIPDPQAQMKIILKEICSLLNAKGGKLYIGVNDEGYVSDLVDDLQWFKEHPNNYHISDIDEYQRYLVNAILRVWKGITPLISVMLQKANDRQYLEVSIAPSRQPLELDGTYYVRIGTTCRPIPKESLQSFLQRRPLQYDQMMGITK